MTTIGTSEIRRSDVIVPGALAIVGAAEILGSDYRPTALGAIAYVFAAAVLSLRRGRPLLMPLAVVAAFVLGALLGADVADVGMWNGLIAFACLSTGLHAPRDQRWLGLGVVLVALVVVMAALEWMTTYDPNPIFGLIATLGPWVFGTTLRAKLDATSAVAAAGERSRLEGLMAADRAAERERSRIAWELHDVLAHTLGAMVMQAAASGELVPNGPHKARRALERIADMGREAVADTGRLLRLIRDPTDELGLGVDVSQPRMPALAEPASTNPRLTYRDGLLPTAFGIAATVEVVVAGFPVVGVWFGAAWLTAAVLCFSRCWPLAMPPVAALVGVAALVASGSNDLPAAWMLAVGIACFAAGSVAWTRLVVSLADVVFALAVLVAGYRAAGDGWADALVMGSVIFLGSWAGGAALRETLDRTRRLAAASELERIQLERQAHQRAKAERKRIARELHDVLAKSFSVMIVQAEVAAEVAGTDTPAALIAISHIESAGRSALEEVSRLLRLIHVGGAGDATEQPQHGVADLPALADEYSRSGLKVALVLADLAGPLPAGVEISAYRIVQEALTNVLKHAPGTTVSVSIDQCGSDVAIEVRNAPTTAVPPSGAHSGHGLDGLRERVALFGGRFNASPTPEGGFVVFARLPGVETI